MIPNRVFLRGRWRLLIPGLVLLIAAGCGAAPRPADSANQGELPEASGQSVALAAAPSVTPLPTRPAYAPGELVEYTAQTGDTLPALSVRFNSTVAEILEANPIIPDSATTMPPGLPMQIPIYYKPLWGSPYLILPDSLFVNGPAQVGFDLEAFVARHPGWLKDYVAYAAGSNRTGAETVAYVAQNFSVSPRLLLALLEYRAGALSQNAVPDEVRNYPLGYRSSAYRGLYLQLVWVANLLNDGYYRWRTGTLTEYELLDGRLVRLDPWLNAASASLQRYFAERMPPDQYASAISADGLAQTYADLFGDPWPETEPHLPGSLAQPLLSLPFEPDKTWALTGGPHTAWGEGAPLAALDFAPPAVAGGCQPSDEWVTAVADGEVVRSEIGTAVLDLDGDQDERTGWVIFYFHLAMEGRARTGEVLRAGDRVGHPSCEGGRATGTHVHIARKYNGEWLPADGVLPFDLDGWIARAGPRPYLGSMIRFDRTVTACICANQASHINRPPE